MNKKKVLSLIINGDTNHFEIEDNFSKLELRDMTATIGFLTSLIHNYHHIHAEKQNKYVMEHDN